MPFGEYYGAERMDQAYDPVPGEPPVCPQPDYELGAPYSFFEYEQDDRLHLTMVYDQQFIPEDERPFNKGKHPHCSKEYWRPQEDIRLSEEMQKHSWIPETKLNEYNSRKHRPRKIDYQDQDLF